MKKLIQFAVFVTFLLMPLMAYAVIPATMIWEIRPGNFNGGPSQNNGGGYCGVGHTADDYSIVDANHFYTTALKAKAANGNSVWNSSGTAFDVNDVNNVVHVTAGTGWTAGWYQVTAVDGNATATLTGIGTAGPATGASGTACLGGAFTWGGTLDDEFTDLAVVAGNTVYIKTGTYTLGEAIAQALDGTAVLPISWIGYKATRNDTCNLTDRPLIAAGSNASGFIGDYSIFKNLAITTSSAAGFSLGVGTTVYNCSIAGSGAASAETVTLSVGGRLIKCRVTSTAGNSIDLAMGSRVIRTFISGGITGCTMSNIYGQIIDCVIDGSTTGIECGAYASPTIMQNTIYNCTTGVSGTTAANVSAINNIITNCVYGINWSTATANNAWYYNCLGNNTYDMDPNDGTLDSTNLLATDPLLTNPAADDFTLQATSPCLNAGMTIGVNQSAVGAYKMNIGVDQDDNTAGGGTTIKKIIAGKK